MPLTVTTQGKTFRDLEGTERTLSEITANRLTIVLDDPLDDSVQPYIEVYYHKADGAYSRQEYRMVLEGQSLLAFFAAHEGLYDTVKAATYDAIKDNEGIEGEVS